MDKTLESLSFQKFTAETLASAEEQARLEELYDLKILDTPPERRFDRITRLAIELIGGEVALISLVDSDRQWFKAKCGLDESEHPREWSFCSHALAGVHKTMMVKDAKHDPRFFDNPLVTRENGIRSYLGVVLKGPTGKPLGTLCVIGTKPRAYSQQDVKQLELLGEIVEAEINREAMLEKTKHAIVKEILYDPLTALPTQRLFTSHLQGWCDAALSSSLRGAVVVINLKRFRVINRVLGLAVGDKILIAVAKVLRDVLPEGGYLARFHDDRFAMIVPEDTEGNTQHALSRISAAIELPMVIDGVRHNVQCVMGVAYFPGNGSFPEALLHNANLAMKMAKSSGVTEAYADAYEEQRALVEQELEVECCFKSADLDKEFRLVYQPIVKASDGECVGVEALVRWEWKPGELLSPEQFIPVLESTGLIIPLSKWILERACADYASLCRRGAVPEYLSVNISGTELLQHNFAKRVKGILEDTGLKPNRLLLEVTEHSVVQDMEVALEQMGLLADIGIRFALDDFGTGHASLKYLQLMPVDVLKIDQSFIAGVHQNERDAAITRATIALAHSLNKQVIAEGVEDDSQLSFIIEQGAEYAQGWYFSKPMNAEQLFEFTATSVQAPSVH